MTPGSGGKCLSTPAELSHLGIHTNSFCKSLLRLSESGAMANVKDIISYTSAVLFMDTPHRGDMDTLSLCDVVERLVALTLEDSDVMKRESSIGFDHLKVEA
jgi:hypothetical protein